jgi:hypothetical protein
MSSLTLSRISSSAGGKCLITDATSCFLPIVYIFFSVLTEWTLLVATVFTTTMETLTETLSSVVYSSWLFALLRFPSFYCLRLFNNNPNLGSLSFNNTFYTWLFSRLELIVVYGVVTYALCYRSRNIADLRCLLFHV